MRPLGARIGGLRTAKRERLEAAILGYLSEMGWTDARTIGKAIGTSHAFTMVTCQLMRDRGDLVSRWQTVDEHPADRPARVLFKRPASADEEEKL